MPAVVGASACCSALAGLALLPFEGPASPCWCWRWRVLLRRDPGRRAAVRSPRAASWPSALGGAFLVRLRRPGARALARRDRGHRRGGRRGVRGRRRASSLRARRRPAATGGAELVGEVGRARVAIGPGAARARERRDLVGAGDRRRRDPGRASEVRVVTVHGGRPHADRRTQRGVSLMTAAIVVIILLVIGLIFLFASVKVAREYERGRRVPARPPDRHQGAGAVHPHPLHRQGGEGQPADGDAERAPAGGHHQATT